MARIVRSTQKIFGVNAAQNQITEFGSIKAGAPVYSQNVKNIQTAAFEGGWSDALQDDYAPYRQDRNAVDLVTTSQLAYLFQEGVPEWDAGTVYYKGSLAKVITASATVQVYMSKVDDNTANYSNADNWAKIFDTGSPYALDSDVVKLAGNQTLNGTKTFTTAPVIRGATGNTVAIFDANKKLVSNTNISNTELGYLDGVTSNIQNQLNAKQTTGNLSQSLDDSTTKYPSNKAVVDFIGTVYPVGSLFFSTASTCPLQTLGIGTWKKVGTSLTLSVNTSVPVKGNGKAMNIGGNWYLGNHSGIDNILQGRQSSSIPNASSNASGGGLTGELYLGLSTDSSKSGIVGTVTRTQINVNVFQRTA